MGGFISWRRWILNGLLISEKLKNGTNYVKRILYRCHIAGASIQNWSFYLEWHKQIVSNWSHMLWDVVSLNILGSPLDFWQSQKSYFFRIPCTGISLMGWWIVSMVLVGPWELDLVPHFSLPYLVKIERYHHVF